MVRHVLFFALLLFGSTAWAAENINPKDFPAASALTGSEKIPTYQSGWKTITPDYFSEFYDNSRVENFGAVGDATGVSGVGQDNADEIQAAHDALYTDTGRLTFGDGIFRTSASITGQLVQITGRGLLGTTIFGDMDDYILNFNNNSSYNFSAISDLKLLGDTQYSGASGIYISPSYNTMVHDIFLRNLSSGIYLDNSWGSKVSDIKAMYVHTPLLMSSSNGSVINHFYAQRFDLYGIRLDDTLAASANGLILEYGISGATGLSLRATQSVNITGIYTEGDMGTDIVLGTKGSRRNLNLVLNGLWLNSTATGALIDATYSSGLIVNGITAQTPAGTRVLTVPTNDYDYVYVSNAIQVDQNANSYVGDYRGTGQSLIPLSQDNRHAFILFPSARHGDGTDADLSNIQTNTALDANGLRPRLYKAPVPAVGSSSGDLTATSSSTLSVYGAESSGFYVSSDFYGSCKIWIRGTVTSSAGSQPFFKLRLTNGTESLSGESSGVVSVAASGTVYERFLHVNVKPGINLITLAITREQGGSGTNTITIDHFALN